MTTAYVDASAALKLLFVEAETEPLRAHLASATVDLISSQLLETEMRRAVHRNPDLAQSDVTALLEGIHLLDTSGVTFRAAGFLPGQHLRSLDALHLASAITAGADAIVTYDVRMTESAESLGLKVVAPC